MDTDKGTVIMTPRIQLNREKQRCERPDHRLLEHKPKRSEQDAEVEAKNPARRTGRGSYRAYGNKTKRSEAEGWPTRKSMYSRWELNRLGTKESNKVRVFSPRASEKCGVKAIEDLKKAKLRAREHKLMMEAADRGIENSSFSVVKCSSDPQKDFRDSMIEMITKNGINHPQELKELLVCYLRLNTDAYYDMII